MFRGHAPRPLSMTFNFFYGTKWLFQFVSEGRHTPGAPLFALGFIPPPKKSWLHPWIHKGRSDRFNILTVANKSVDNFDNRKSLYGAFSPLDLETTLWQQNLKRHKKMKFYYPSWFTKCIEFWKKNYMYVRIFSKILTPAPPNNFCRGTSLK